MFPFLKAIRIPILIIINFILLSNFTEKGYYRQIGVLYVRTIFSSHQKFKLVIILLKKIVSKTYLSDLKEWFYEESKNKNRSYLLQDK